jgi:hypothetical protein
LSSLVNVNLVVYSVFPGDLRLCALQALLLEELLGLSVKAVVSVDVGLLLSKQEIVGVLLMLTLLFDSLHPGDHILDLDLTFIELCQFLRAFRFFGIELAVPFTISALSV